MVQDKIRHRAAQRMIKAGIQKGGAGRDHSPVVSMPSSGAARTKKIHVSLSCDVKAVAVLANKRMIVFHKRMPADRADKKVHRYLGMYGLEVPE